MQFSFNVNTFQGLALPEKAWLVGYAALINVYQLEVPLPTKLAAISAQHKKYETETWSIFTPRHKPKESLTDHLTFALRYEGIDLAVRARQKEFRALTDVETIELEEVYEEIFSAK